MKKFLFGFGFVALTVACTPKIVEATDNTETTTETSAEPSMSADAIEGKQIYAKSCTKCHDFKVIDNYSQEQWAGILPNMITKAKLDDTSAKQVTDFVNWELEH